MKIFRGNVGVEMSLEEFSEMIQDDEQIDELLDLIYELEMEDHMNFEQYEEYEQELLEQMDKYQKEQQSTSENGLMQRILDHLDKYGG